MLHLLLADLESPLQPVLLFQGDGSSQIGYQDQIVATCGFARFQSVKSGLVRRRNIPFDTIRIP